MKPRRRPGAPPAAARVPAFRLYGEHGASGVELLHVEDLPSRSRRFGWAIDAHVHHGLYQVLWVRSGRATVALDDLRETVEGPVALVVPAGAVHGFRFNPDVEGHVLTFSASWLVQGEHAAVGDAFRTLFAAPRLLRVAPGGPELQRITGLFDALAAEFDAAPISAAASDAASPTPGWLARAVVWRLAQACAQPAGGDATGRAHRALFTRFAALAEQHYAEHWPVSRYATRLGLTIERLNRLVRAQVGRSALAYLHERLTREACRRLIYVDAPVSKLAEELGFEDPAYFCRFFKRRTGLSPSRYRADRGDGT